MINFNQSKNNYRDIVEKSIRFTGKEHDFFIHIKSIFLIETLKKNFQNVSDLRILDVGCGHGFIHKFLKCEQLKVVGLEVASDVLEIAKKMNPDVSYVSYDGLTFPFQSSSFDVLLAVCVLHHVKPSQWHSLLSEMKRVLRKNGIAVIFEHNPYNPLTRYVVAKNVLDKDAVLLSSLSLKRFLAQTGFIKIKSKFFLFTPFKIFFYLDKILNWLPLGAQYYTVAKVSKLFL